MAKAKTTTAKKPAASKAKPAAAKTTTKAKGKAKPVEPPKKVMTKTQIIQDMADRTEMTKKQVTEFFEHLLALVKDQVSSGNPGKITLPSLAVKLELKDVDAKPAREGRNPATGETMMFAAKPASRSIKATAMKSLKETVA